METKQITNFLEALMDGVSDGQKKLYKSILESSEIPSFKTPEEFYFTVIYPYEKFVRGFIKSEISPSHDIEFCLMHQRYLDRSFCDFFKEYEGFACSADKSRTVVKRIVEFFKTGHRIEFDYEQEYTFHLPKKVFKTHDHIMLMYEGLKNLQYGSNKKYIEALKTTILPCATQPAT